jgi:hypothetical protein
MNYQAETLLFQAIINLRDIHEEEKPPMNDELKLFMSQWPVLSHKTKERLKEIAASDMESFIVTFNLLVKVQQELEQTIEQLRPRAEHLHNERLKTEKTLRRALLKRVK